MTLRWTIAHFWFYRPEQLYLLHEHYICGTLEAAVKKQVDDHTSTYEGRIPLLEVKGYISNILAGIQLIHSYGVSCKYYPFTNYPYTLYSLLH